MGEISDFEGEEFYGIRIDFAQRKEEIQEDLEEEIESNEITIWTYGETEEWKEANAKLGEKKHGLCR